MQSRVKEEAELLPTKKSTLPESEDFSQGADTGKSLKHRTMLAFMNELQNVMNEDATNKLNKRREASSIKAANHDKE